MRAIACVLTGLGLSLTGARAHAVDDIEFVAEHLPEVAMDNRYATLPIWGSQKSPGPRWFGELQTGWTSTTSGSLEIAGPMFSASVGKQVGPSWRAGAFAFYDPLQLTSGTESRPLQTLFAPGMPIERPVAAEFSGLDGTAEDHGAGVFVSYEAVQGWLGRHRWLLGATWQRMVLKQYAFDYRITEGPRSGATGTIDFDATYEHLVPFVGAAWPRDHGQWSGNAHLLLAWPIPRRGVVGHITGPGFDIHGDTENVGEGKHFGDPSLTIGYAILYRPWGLSVDFGTALMQSVLEPRIHRGIERTLVLSFSLALGGGD
jgi:hypothetical protein